MHAWLRGVGRRVGPGRGWTARRDGRARWTRPGDRRRHLGTRHVCHRRRARPHRRCRRPRRRSCRHRPRPPSWPHRRAPVPPAAIGPGAIRRCCSLLHRARICGVPARRGSGHRRRRGVGDRPFLSRPPLERSRSRRRRSGWRPRATLAPGCSARRRRGTSRACGGARPPGHRGHAGGGGHGTRDGGGCGDGPLRAAPARPPPLRVGVRLCLLTDSGRRSPRPRRGFVRCHRRMAPARVHPQRDPRPPPRRPPPPHRPGLAGERGRPGRPGRRGTALPALCRWGADPVPAGWLRSGRRSGPGQLVGRARGPGRVRRDRVVAGGAAPRARAGRGRGGVGGAGRAGGGEPPFPPDRGRCARPAGAPCPHRRAGGVGGGGAGGVVAHRRAGSGDRAPVVEGRRPWRRHRHRSRPRGPTGL